MFLQPHRGGTILTLGILGLLVCAICGIFAWTMGNRDLAEMAAGRMDPSGMGSTKAGKICGMIATFFMIAGLLFYVVIIAIIGVNGGRF